MDEHHTPESRALASVSAEFYPRYIVQKLLFHLSESREPRPPWLLPILFLRSAAFRITSLGMPRDCFPSHSYSCLQGVPASSNLASLLTHLAQGHGGPSILWFVLGSASFVKLMNKHNAQMGIQASSISSQTVSL